MTGNPEPQGDKVAPIGGTKEVIADTILRLHFATLVRPMLESGTNH
jgi:hypothetical protein